MKAKTFAAATVILLGAATASHAGDAQLASSTSIHPAGANASQSLDALLAQWNEAAFTPPVKPAQYRVYGRNGYVTTGPGYGAMVSSIRAAVIAVREGRDSDAKADIDRAKGLLASTAPANRMVADK